MKGKFVISVLFIVGFLVAITVGCDPEPVEYCEQDTVCDVDVQSCCSDENGVQTCVWKYNGQEYSNMDDLIDNLGCASSTSLKSSITGPTREEIALKLTELMERAHAGLYSILER